MHEMGIANSILDAVRREAARFPGGHVHRVGVRIGALAGVNPDSLDFCFHALVLETDFLPLELAIEPAARDELEIAFLEVEDGTDSAATQGAQ